MKRHPSLIPLSHDHRQGLFLVQIIKRGIPRFPGTPTTPDAKREYALQEYAAMLREHFRVEEEVLVPMMRGVDSEIDTLLITIAHEHRALEALITSLPQATTVDDLEEQLHTLGVQLEQHIRMEERQLFQRIQAVVSEEVLASLGQALDGYAQAACRYNATTPPE